jgi:hypothetical protein
MCIFRMDDRNSFGVLNTNARPETTAPMSPERVVSPLASSSRSYGVRRKSRQRPDPGSPPRGGRVCDVHIDRGQEVICRIVVPWLDSLECSGGAQNQKAQAGEWPVAPALLARSGAQIAASGRFEPTASESDHESTDWQLRKPSTVGRARGIAAVRQHCRLLRSERARRRRRRTGGGVRRRHALLGGAGPPADR